MHCQIPFGAVQGGFQDTHAQGGTWQGDGLTMGMLLCPFSKHAQVVLVVHAAEFLVTGRAD